ncbi:unnamed protein product, partial [Bubo scandiacus]
QLLQGRKQFSKLSPKICYFNPSVLTRHIKVDLQGKMLLVILSEGYLFHEPTHGWSNICESSYADSYPGPGTSDAA